MTVSPEIAEPELEPELWQRPRLQRDRRLLAGVAGGIAEEIGIDAIYVRVAFVVLTIAGGWGGMLYVVAWLAMRTTSRDGYEPIPKGQSPGARMIGVGLVGLGLVLAAGSLGINFPAEIVWPSVVLGIGIAVAVDGGEWAKRSITELSRPEFSWLRVAAGIGCLFIGVIVSLTLSLNPAQALSGIVVAGLALVGAAIVFAPALRRSTDDLFDERRLRIRSEEKAEMAAHLHDSVLQTLTLIQRQSEDTAVVGLARQQERELRSWLFDDRALNPNLGFRSELERLMGDVENRHRVPIEIVVVGDTTVAGDVPALLGAAREAATNAAKHSKANRIDVYAEVQPERIELFVRDQGIGFDPTLVDGDRKGVRESIVARMERHGGSATIHSTLGAGTEVELSVAIAKQTDSEEGASNG